ncbi:MAG: lamin tail domain-containing protein, partial [candidate division KSB1 bacterium]|nr:lamin tail domain-containing protein [candidate division KSB1 bacterium]
AFPHRGYEFEAWNDPALPASDRVTLTLNGDYAIAAIFMFDPPIEPQVVINEINYQSAADFDPEDWVELYNLTDRKINLSGWHLKDSRDDHDFILAEGTHIAAHGFKVICRNMAFFESHFPLVKEHLGNFPFGLRREGEVIRLFDANMNLVDSVRYSSSGQWPGQADGGGSTLELIEPLLDNSQAENWQASKGHGTPGRTNSTGWNNIAENTTIGVVPRQTMLAANYPNPFNAMTCIRYQLAEAAAVEIEIFNLAGQCVATLLSMQQSAGNYQLLFDGRDSGGQPLPSGIYLVRLKTQRLLDCRKMVLIR